MTLDELRRRAAAAPSGTLLAIESLREVLGHPKTESNSKPELDQREASSRLLLLWTADPKTRMGRDELLEAVGKSRSWFYKGTGPKAADRIPRRRLDGELVFVVGEVRLWLRDREQIFAACVPDSSLQIRHPTSPVTASGSI